MSANPCVITRITMATGTWEVSTNPEGSTVAFGPGGRQVDFGYELHDEAVEWMRQERDRRAWPAYCMATAGAPHRPPYKLDNLDTDRCRLCDAHVSEPHDPACAVGALVRVHELAIEALGRGTDVSPAAIIDATDGVV